MSGQTIERLLLSNVLNHTMGYHTLPHHLRVMATQKDNTEEMWVTDSTPASLAERTLHDRTPDVLPSTHGSSAIKAIRLCQLHTDLGIPGRRNVSGALLPWA